MNSSSPAGRNELGRAGRRIAHREVGGAAACAADSCERRRRESASGARRLLHLLGQQIDVFLEEEVEQIPREQSGRAAWRSGPTAGSGCSARHSSAISLLSSALFWASGLVTAVRSAAGTSRRSSRVLTSSGRAVL